MRKFLGVSLILSLCSAIAMPIFAQKTETVSAATTPTGYTKASDVNYVKSGGYIANWGARDEDCVFLSSYATNFYTGSYSYDQMSLKAGGSSTSTAPTSALYKALQSMMKEEQTYETSYNATRDKFRYTDCVSSNYSNISSFYSGEVLSGAWDGGSTWNREHTWPNSKGDASGNGENDIMMLRPTSVKENSSRGNKAYGESGSYYDPNQHGQNVRGDCARIMLFVYTRWGNTGSMWGSSGVMESLNVLLKWMEEDPVDTWEMGRNDAVQSITGTRNVFVDYPEYAWMLFGKSVPTNMVTPSGKASDDIVIPPNQEECTHRYGEWTVVTPATTETEGLQKHTCRYCGYEETETIPKLEKVECNHRFGAWTVVKPATATEEGLQMHACRYCGYEETETIPVVCNHRFGDWTVTVPATTETDGEKEHACRYCGYKETESIPKLEEVINSEDSVSDSEASSDSAILDEDVNSAVSDAIGLATASCQAVIGMPMLGVAVLAIGGILLKRKEN